ncbi:unnamed protein product [marine sediment metagenome]|uniref:Uncharacterized protein n=1 Tax=marine sediment metagenome TaxID=412755 RepID=X1U0J0_9ZZZZ
MFFLCTAKSFKASVLISTLKCPELAKIAPSFIKGNSSTDITFISPVKVIKMSPILAASFMGIT